MTARWLALAFLLLMLGGCRTPPRGDFDSPRSSNRSLGETLPPPQRSAELVFPDGTRKTIEEFKGQALVLIFNRGYAGYVCPYCTTYSAQMASRYEDFKKLGAEVVLVYPTLEGEESKVKEFMDSVKALLAEQGEDALGVPVALDAGAKIVKKFEISGDVSKPSTFILDRQGLVRYAYVGANKEDRPSIDSLLEELKQLP